VGKGISIIAVGDEVLYGVTPNTNATCIAEALVDRGYAPITHVVVSDDAADIADVLARELRAGRDVVVTGGLGPTIDDNTKSVAAQLFSSPLVRNEALFSDLASRYGETYPTLESQSLQPQKAVLLQNTVGTAPGVFLEDEAVFPGARLFLLPGPPHEMRDVLFHEMIPRFFPQQDLFCRTFHLLGLKEHDIDPLLRELQRQYPSLRIGIYPSYELIRVRLLAATKSERASLEQAVLSFKEAFSSHLFLGPENTLETAVSSLLRKRGWKIATAESCTGGGLAARLISLPGASEVVSGGIVAYQDCIKESVLGVPSDILKTYGAVSTEVTECMVRGAERLFGVQVACAVSGFFGPTGGTEACPIGTVCASFLTEGRVSSERYVFHGTREALCEKTIQALLAKLVLVIS
jgi:nicotinamide-nucleotide amidase